ncbi:lipocalin family protein [Alistipes sp. An116]|uniref:lipocalin family protein n=1 Tax=Alistipes sp. An116 TaxID=1965546 RepID=UPI001EF631AE|nr:lipocalin family protein [Alistipes sp. An116]
MKKSMWIAAVALLGAAACGERVPGTFTGHITDASMNQVTVQDLSSEQTYTFSLADADRSEAYGLLVGAPVAVEYRGRLEDGADALKVSTNPTYAEAVGRWMLYNEEHPEFTMGVEIRVEGEAVSINSATLLYSGWELLDEADKILLRGRSVGNGASFDFSQTGVIARDAEGRLQMTIEGTEVVFTKVAGPEMPAAEAEAAGDGQVETEQNPAGDTAASGSVRADSASVAK